MHPHVSVLYNSLSTSGAGPYILAGIVAAIVVVSKLSQSSRLDAIPTVGPRNLLELWWNGPKSKMGFFDLIQQGYDKYKSSSFKIRTGKYWMIVLNSRQHIEEVRKAPDSILTFSEPGDNGKIKYAMGEEAKSSSDYAHGALVSYLIRGSTGVYSEIRDEICASFDDVLDLKDHEWKSVPILVPVQTVVARASNRLFIGLPLCRDPDWISLNVRHTLNINEADRLLGRFPYFLAPIVVRFTKVRENIAQGMRIIGPMIEERINNLEEHGKGSEKPSDLLSHFIKSCPEGPERTVKAFTQLMMAVNMAAVHTTSHSFFQVLLYLAENPQYIKPLRDEVNSIVENEGWTKAALGKMRKIDSFLKESQRLKGITPMTISRTTQKDFTMSDGTHIPKDMKTVAPTRWVHLDNEHYHNAHVFDPFRFSDMREEDGEGTKHQFVSTSLEYLPFGHGKHACPGRFFAATMLKTMLAHVLMSYDLKLDNAKPAENVPGSDVFDFLSKVMFRRRVENVNC